MLRILIAAAGRLGRRALIAACGFLGWAATGYGQPLITEFPLPGTRTVNYLPELYGRSITAGPDGAIWFTHFQNSRIVRMTIDGTVTEFDVAPALSPSGIAVGPDRNIWFGTLSGEMAIGRVTPSGQLAEFPLKLDFPSAPAGFTAGSDGNIWFTEATRWLHVNGPAPTAIGKITPGGQITSYPLPYGTSATAIVPSPEGNL